MENLENMDRIEALQTELGQFLVSFIPVPWKKICLYAECAPGYASVWYAFVEAETDVISVQHFFWNRYDTYPVDEMNVVKRLSRLSLDLYNAYLERFGEEKIWKAMYYTLFSDGKVQNDFQYEPLSKDLRKKQDDVFKRFFNTEYKYYKGKYPSKDFILPKKKIQE